MLNPLLYQCHRFTDKVVITRSIWQKHGHMRFQFSHVFQFYRKPVTVIMVLPMRRGKKTKSATLGGLGSVGAITRAGRSNRRSLRKGLIPYLIDCVGGCDAWGNRKAVLFRFVICFRSQIKNRELDIV